MSRIGGPVSTFCFVVWLTILCRATVHDVLCKKGSGAFQAHFRTGVNVSVGPQKKGLLSTRACSASIRWGDQQLVVADTAAQLDLDSFGVDMDEMGPVAGFQIKQSDAQCCMAYQIYSLEIPPRLLRTINGEIGR